MVEHNNNEKHKPPFAGPEVVFAYLARYTRRWRHPEQPAG
jgi:hypothetical protein